MLGGQSSKSSSNLTKTGRGRPFPARRLPLVLGTQGEQRLQGMLQEAKESWQYGGVRQRSLPLLEECGHRQHHLPNCLNRLLRVPRGPTRSSYRLAPTSTPSLPLRVKTNSESLPLRFGIPLLIHVLLVLLPHEYTCIFCFCFGCSSFLHLAQIICWAKGNWLS